MAMKVISKEMCFKMNTMLIGMPKALEAYTSQTHRNIPSNTIMTNDL